jgi:2-polyprenyl-6-hydroxyphenyl methylase/3-demethylubiquinone-9 3-methyltransferase
MHFQWKDFSKQWWDLDGPYQILHQLLPLRMSFIASTVSSLKDLSVLDVGCGGGLLCEELFQSGANIYGIDSCPHTLQTAKEHAEQQGFCIQYRSPDQLEELPLFDLVCMMEVLEHISNPYDFLKKYVALLKPGGFLLGSTMNRSFLSWSLGIHGAEKLKWVPENAHHWAELLKPEELAVLLNALGLKEVIFQGYGPWGKSWDFQPHLKINYFFKAQKPQVSA